MAVFDDEDHVLSFLVHAGYFTLDSLNDHSKQLFKLEVPNLECRLILNQFIKKKFETLLPFLLLPVNRTTLRNAFEKGDEREIRDAITRVFSDVHGEVKLEETYKHLLYFALSEDETISFEPDDVPAGCGKCDGIVCGKIGYVNEFKITKLNANQQNSIKHSNHNDLDKLLSKFAEDDRCVKTKYRMLITFIQKRPFVKLVPTT